MGGIQTRFCGQGPPSSRSCPDIVAGTNVLSFNDDTGERYLLVESFLPAE